MPPDISVRGLQSKFEQAEGAFELSYATLDKFFGGLERILGAPDIQVLIGMQQEHCCVHRTDERPDAPPSTLEESCVSYTTGNYTIVTSPLIEWFFGALR